MIDSLIDRRGRLVNCGVLNLPEQPNQSRHNLEFASKLMGYFFAVSDILKTHTFGVVKRGGLPRRKFSPEHVVDLVAAASREGEHPNTSEIRQVR